MTGGMDGRQKQGSTTMRLKASLVFVTLFAVTLLVVAQTLPPPPLPATAPAGEFSAERAIRHIHAIAQQPRPTGSAANKEVRDYILAELKNLGLEAQTQPDGELENVMGRIQGAHSSEAVLLTAHLDSTLQSPGATDDGVGVAVLLETARALLTAAPMRNTVMFLFTDHEEGGLYGAKAFIAHHSWTKDVKVVIGFDAGGVSGPGVLSTTSPNNGWLIRHLAQADPYVVGNSAINALGYSSTDFGRAFKPGGFSGYAFDLYWDKRDGPEDTIANLNPASLQHQGYHALSLARQFGHLNSLADTKERDIVYFSVLRLFLVTYTAAWAIPSAIAVMGVFIALLAYGLRRRILSWRGLVYGMFVMLVGVMIAPLPSIVLEFLVGRWIPGVTAAFDNRLLDQPPQMSLLVLIALTLTLFWYALARRIRKTSLPDLTLGGLIPIAVGMVVISIALPALSYGFTWPLLFSLLANANWFRGSVHTKPSMLVILGLLLLGALNIVIVGPAIVLGLFDQLALTLAFLGVLGGLLMPQLYLMLGYTTEHVSDSGRRKIAP
jgi:MFS family permease